MIELSRQSTEEEIKEAYNLGLHSIQQIAELAKRDVEEVLSLVFVDGESGGTIERREAEAAAAQAPAKK